MFSIYPVLLTVSVPSQALLPPVHPDEVHAAHLLVGGGDHPGTPYFWGVATAVRRDGLTDVVAPGGDGLAAQMLARGTAGVTIKDGALLPLPDPAPALGTQQSNTL